MRQQIELPIEVSDPIIRLATGVDRVAECTTRIQRGSVQWTAERVTAALVNADSGVLNSTLLDADSYELPIA